MDCLIYFLIAMLQGLNPKGNMEEVILREMDTTVASKTQFAIFSLGKILGPTANAMSAGASVTDNCLSQT